jgi:hypothetical protein
MQIFPGPRFLAKPPLRLVAQLPQSRPGALCPVLVRGEIDQEITDQALTLELRSAAWRRTVARTFSSTLRVMFFITTVYV